MGGLSTAEKNRRKRERKKREKEDRRQQEEAEMKQNDAAGGEEKKDADQVEIEYVVESLPVMESLLPPAVNKERPTANDSDVPDGLPPGMGGSDAAAAAASNENNPQEDISAVLRRFNQRAAVAAVVSDDERKPDGWSGKTTTSDGGSEEDDDRKYNDDDEDDDDDDDKKPMSKRKLREMIRPSVAALKRRVTKPDLVEAHDVCAADPDFLIHLKGIPGTVPVPRHWGRKRKYLQGKRGFEKPPFQVRAFVLL